MPARYQADLQAQPVRWANLSTAVAIAINTWSALSPRVDDAALSARFEAAVGALADAAGRSDRRRADVAARDELTLVDELEAYFSQPVRSLNRYSGSAI
jgi:hypothetical protein